MMRGILGLALALLNGAAHADLPAVLGCMRANLPDALRIDSIEFAAYGSDPAVSARVTTASLLAESRDGEWHATLKLRTPEDLAGAAWLLRERRDGQEVYSWVPALKKVRQLVAGDLEQPLFGSTLSQRDLVYLLGAVRTSQLVLRAADTVAGRAVDTLSIFPPAGAGRDVEVRSRIDRESCAAILVEFIDANGVRKTLRANPESLRSAGRFRYFSELEMRDARSGQRTVVRLRGVEADARLDRRSFEPRSFYR